MTLFGRCDSGNYLNCTATYAKLHQTSKYRKLGPTTKAQLVEAPRPYPGIKLAGFFGYFAVLSLVMLPAAVAFVRPGKNRHSQGPCRRDFTGDGTDFTHSRGRASRNLCPNRQKGVTSRNGNFSTLRRRRGTGAKNEAPEFN
jgi:hypothetical protein